MKECMQKFLEEYLEEFLKELLEASWRDWKGILEAISRENPPIFGEISRRILE